MTQSEPVRWEGRRVLVAGGTGFLGRRMVQRLNDAHARVVSVSRGEGCDLRDRGQAERFMNDFSPEVVFNFAANQGGVLYQEQQPATIFHDNLLIVVNTMEAARAAGVQRYVSIIAGCAYPDYTPDGILREKDFDAGPMHESADNYGITKRVAVMQAKHYRRQYGFNVTSLALANSYGPGDHFGSDRSHALAALLRRYYEARESGASEVVVWGRGGAERDWLFADDAISGILRALDRCPDYPLLNIATGRAVTTAALAETICRVVGYPGRTVFDPSKPEGPAKKTLDVSTMRRLLDWGPPTPLEEGVRQTLLWLEEHRQEIAHGP